MQPNSTFHEFAMKQIKQTGKIFILILLAILTGCDGYQSKGRSWVYVTWDEANFRTEYKIEGIDDDTFQILHKRGYAKDKYHAYFHWHVVAEADMDSFVSLSELYAKDAHHVYYSGEKVELANPADFSMIAPEWGRDNNDVYHKTTAIHACSPVTFVFLPEMWRRDGKCVYDRLGRKLPGADPASFQVVNFSYGKDKNKVFFENRVLKGADPDTFELWCSPCEVCARDKNRCYTWDKIVDCECRK